MALKEKPPADRNAPKTKCFGSKNLYQTPSRQTKKLGAESEVLKRRIVFCTRKKGGNGPRRKRRRSVRTFCSPANAPLLQSGGVVTAWTQRLLLGGRRSRLVAMLQVFSQGVEKQKGANLRRSGHIESLFFAYCSSNVKAHRGRKQKRISHNLKKPIARAEPKFLSRPCLTYLVG